MKWKEKIMIKNKVGFLIIIEGLDGTGKSLHSKLLQDKFIEAGYKVFCTREPGGTPVGEEIRKILKSDVPMSISTQAYLFASSRNQNNIKILEMISKSKEVTLKIKNIIFINNI